MKTKANDLAMSRPYSHDERPSGGYEGDRPETFQAQEGLTKREYFAAMAIQGLLTSTKYILYPITQVAKDAVNYADALIKELNKDD